MDVSVIIVNYNTSAHLSKCLDSIINFTNGIEYEILVVDNNSPQRDIENYPARFPLVKFYLRDVNDGFGAGCNYGTNFSKGKYLAFVNPDVIFKYNSLSTLYKYLETNSSVGLCSGIFVNEFEEPIYSFNDFPNLYWEITEALFGNGDAKIRKLLSSKNIDVNNTIPLEVDWVIGACMFMRKNLFEKLEGFDKNMFLYCEDVDLQFRLRQIGSRVMCLPNIRINHFTRSSVRAIEGDEIYNLNMHRSKIIYMYKHWNFINRNIIRISYIIGFFIRILVLPFRKRFRRSKVKKFKQHLIILKLYIIPNFYQSYKNRFI
jgi:GT2 family glycosyltransferase